MLGTNIRTTESQGGVSRRDFLKFCSLMTGVLALPRSYMRVIENALETKQRLPVIWLEMQDCAGCTEALLRATQPTVGQLVLDVLSVDYHETIMAASGNLAEEAKQATIDAGGYLLVVEGSIPVGDGEFYCTIGGKSSLQLLNEAAANAEAVVAVGNCAAFGGWPYATPNPTNASFVSEIIKDKPVMNLPGCPYNPVNLTAAVVHFLTFGELPAMDDLHRPLFAYGALIHDNCPRRGHFDAGEFVVAWGDEGHKKGWCLYARVLLPSIIVPLWNITMGQVGPSKPVMVASHVPNRTSGIWVSTIRLTFSVMLLPPPMRRFNCRHRRLIPPQQA